MNYEKVDNFRVKVEYVVELSDFEILEELYNELRYLEELNHPKVLDFLSENIKGKDAFEWSYEIEEISATE